MVLGTNDAAVDDRALDFGCQVNNTTFAVGPARRVYWINAYNGASAASLRRPKAVNSALVAQDRAHTNLAKSEWYGFVSARVPLLQSDHEHPAGGCLSTP